MKNIVLTREEIAHIATRIALDERKGVATEFLSMLQSMGRMVDVLELLRGDKTCFCLLTNHTIPCLKATEIVRLLAKN